MYYGLHNDKISFHFCKKSKNNIEDLIEEIYKKAQTKLVEAVTDFEKFTQLLEIVKNFEQN